MSFVASHAKWLVAIAAILGVVGAWQDRDSGVTYWIFATANIAFYVQLAVSLTCLAYAAWQARADRQPGVAELANTFPAGRSAQIVINWTAIAAWGLLAYAGAFVVAVALLAPDATWGVPEWQDAAYGAAVVVGASAVGYALGFAVPTFLAIPVWVIGWFALDAVLSSQDSSLSWIAPRSIFEKVDRSLFRRTVPDDVTLRQAGWFLAVAAFALALCILGADRRRWSLGLVAITGAVVVVSSIGILRVPGSVPYGTGSARAFQPVCERSEVVEVCLHPAEQPLLGEATDLLTRFLEPVAGLPGVPTRFVDSAVAPADRSQGGIYVNAEDDLALNAAMAVAEALFPPQRGGGWEMTEEQAVIATWLYARAGLSYESAPYWTFALGKVDPTTTLDQAYARIQDRARTFGKLPSETQRRWLEVHFAALQDGTLDASALP